MLNNVSKAKLFILKNKKVSKFGWTTQLLLIFIGLIDSIKLLNQLLNWTENMALASQTNWSSLVFKTLTRRRRKNGGVPQRSS